jgi:mRNA interferase RelE/StbE
LAWTVKFDARAAKELRKLDEKIARRILKFVRERLVPSENPRSLGEPLKGDHAHLWRWRVGDYRMIGEIRDAEIGINIVALGHRREIYR